MEQSISFDRIADRYDQTRGGLRRGRDVAEAIEPHLGGAERVLEVGVGTGAVAVALSDLGRKVIGVDISRDMLERAAERLGSRVMCGDAHALPIPSDAFGAAYLVWVLHLVADAAAVVRECARVLHHGARLAVVAGQARPDADAASDMIPIVTPLRAVRDARLRSDEAEAVEAWAASAGLALVTRAERGESFKQSPAGLARVIEQRSFSYLWDIDDQTWSQVVVPIIDSLRALPEPDRPRTFRQYQDVLVFEKALVT